MKLFGNKKMFAIGYELDLDSEYGPGEAELRVFIDDKSVSTYMFRGILTEFKWDIRDIVEWLEKDMSRILNEEEGFPLPVQGSNALELYENSHFESDNEDEEDAWYDIRYEWFYDHSWLSSRAGGFLARLFFRRIGNMIEISWDNRKLFTEENVEFINPVGVFYVEVDYMEKVVTDFVDAFNVDLGNNS